MANYDIYFSGQIMQGQDPVLVRERIGRMFKASEAQLQALFSGNPVRIKAGVDQDTAIKFRTAFRDAGALIDIRPAGQAAPAPVPAAPSPAAAPAPAQAPAQPARPSPVTAPPPPPSPPPAETPPAAASARRPVAAPDAGALAAIELLPPNTGSLEEFAIEEEPVEIGDISKIGFDTSNTPLDPSLPPPPPEIDTSAIKLDPNTNRPLDDTPPPPPFRVDLGNLQLGAANSGSLEEFAIEEKPAPLPDISGLKLG